MNVNDWTNLYDKLIINYDPKLILNRDLAEKFVLSGVWTTRRKLEVLTVSRVYWMIVVEYFNIKLMINVELKLIVLCLKCLSFSKLRWICKKRLDCQAEKRKEWRSARYSSWREEINQKKDIWFELI